MDNPKIKIESDGITASVHINGEPVSCVAVDFHGDVEDDINIKWDATCVKRNEDGTTIVSEIDKIEYQKFSYDSKEAVTQCEH